MSKFIMLRPCLTLLLLLAGSDASAQAPLLPPRVPALDAPSFAASLEPLSPAPNFSPALMRMLGLPVAAPPDLRPVPRIFRARLPPPPARRPLPAPPLVTRVTERQIVYGQSARGRALTAWVLDNGMPAPDTDTLIFGGFHGNERSTPGVVESLRAFLLQTPQAWPRRRVVLVPIANPDGWAAGTRANAHGVDINRNFPDGWQPAARAARYSPGLHAASEPETRAIIALLARVRPAKIVSLHSPLRCLNWTGDLGRMMAQVMHPTDHLPVTADIGYPTPGSLGNYCGTQNIGIVTLELPEEAADAAWQQNRAAFLAVINLIPPEK